MGNVDLAPAGNHPGVKLPGPRRVALHGVPDDGYFTVEEVAAQFGHIPDCRRWWDDDGAAGSGAARVRAVDEGIPMLEDLDPAETREWLDALDSVMAFEGADRAFFLLDEVIEEARRKGAPVPYCATTPYLNTIPPDQEDRRTRGDRAIEHRIRSLIRWNALAIVLRANKESSELGGHIASFQSAATLYDVGFMHFLARAGRCARRRPDLHPGPFLARASTPAPSWRAGSARSSC